MLMYGVALFAAVEKHTSMPNVHTSPVRSSATTTSSSRSYRAEKISGLHDLCDLAHVSGCKPHNLHDLQYILCPGLDLYRVDPVQHLITAD